MSMYYFQVRFARGLPRCEFTVLKELAAFANDEDICWASDAAIEACTAYGDRSVDVALEKLEELKLIVIKLTGHYAANGAFVRDGRRIYLQRSEIDRYISKEFDLTKPNSVEVTKEELEAKGVPILKGKPTQPNGAT